MKDEALVLDQAEPPSHPRTNPKTQRLDLKTKVPPPASASDDSKVVAFFDPLNKTGTPNRSHHRFPIGPRTLAFRKKHFPQVSSTEWNDWRWQARNRVRALADLSRMIRLSDDERSAIERHTGALPVGITPYYASLMSETDASDPIRRTVVPVQNEYLKVHGEADDPLGEDHDTKVPGLVHRYPDRVLFLTTGFCSTYCRYCTRSRMVGEVGGEYHFSVPQWDKALEYIEATPSIRDVLLSGGDPLTLADEKLDYLLGRLRKIKHVEFVRIGTKQPVVLPQRVTPAFTRMIKKHHPLWMSVHFLHPDEMTPEVEESMSRLADAGVPLGSQTVLLKGVNDDVETMKALMHTLLRNRVKPYYIFQCDPITGSSHFRTPVEKGLEIVKGLRGHTTGYAVPQYVIDAPGGGGKVALMPDAIVGRDGTDLLLRNFEGKVYRYADPDGTLGADRGKPADL